MNRRNFVTGLLSVPVAAVALSAMPESADNDALSVDTPVKASKKAHWPYQGRKAEYIIVDDPFVSHDRSRQEHTELMAKWYNSRIDTLIHRSLYHG